MIDYNTTRVRVLQDIDHERNFQVLRWGRDQRHPDGTTPDYADRRDFYRMRCEQRAKDGEATWFDILLEEVYEAAAEPETDPKALRKELIQVAAVVAAWVEDLDTRE